MNEINLRRDKLKKNIDANNKDFETVAYKSLSISDFNKKYDNIRFFPKKSASNSVVYTGINIEDEFPVYFKVFCLDCFHNMKLYNNEELLYELSIYNYLNNLDDEIKNLVHHNIILPIDIFSINKSELEKNITPKGNFMFEDILLYENNNKSKDEYIFIVTPNYQGNNLESYLKNILYDGTFNKNILTNILFELIYGVYFLNEKFGIIHNDLHFGNIIIKKLNKPIIKTYLINGAKVYKTSYYNVYIYDFDRAFFYPENVENFILQKDINKENGVVNDSTVFDLKKHGSIDIFTILISLFYMKQNKKPNQIVILDDIIKNMSNSSPNINKNLKQLFDDNKTDEKKFFWNRFCDRTDISKSIPPDCVRPTYPDLEPGKVLLRFVNEYKNELNFIEPKTEAIYWKKYLKYKQKYLELKKQFPI
jgi:hypothetical protein